MMLDPEQSSLFPELPHAGLIKAATRQVRAKFGRLGRERLLLAARSAAVRAACEERKFQEQLAVDGSRGEGGRDEEDALRDASGLGVVGEEAGVNTDATLWPLEPGGKGAPEQARREGAAGEAACLPDGRVQWVIGDAGHGVVVETFPGAGLGDVERWEARVDGREWVVLSASIDAPEQALEVPAAARGDGDAVHGASVAFPGPPPADQVAETASLLPQADLLAEAPASPEFDAGYEAGLAAAKKKAAARPPLRSELPVPGSGYTGYLGSSGALDDELLREEAANMTGVELDLLPRAKLLRDVVGYLYSLLMAEVPEGRGVGLSAAKLVVACKLYDKEIPLEALAGTFEAVGVTDSLTERAFYCWIVLMFGECTESEFLSGAHEFGLACENVRGLGIIDEGGRL